VKKQNGPEMLVSCHDTIRRHKAEDLDLNYTSDGCPQIKV